VEQATAFHEDRPLRVDDLGPIPYRRAWELQRSAQQSLISGSGCPTLFLCEHPPVITLGRRGARDAVRAPQNQLDSLGIEVIESDRGGDATWHGPGQLVAYPILNLSRLKRDVGWYMRSLEECVIRTIARWGISSFRIPGKTGVWTGDPESDINQPPSKIAALGVRISRWCTLHGLSLNVTDCRWGFALIHPCGMPNVTVTSLEEELARRGLGAPPLRLVKQALVEEFGETFQLAGVCGCRRPR